MGNPVAFLLHFCSTWDHRNPRQEQEELQSKSWMNWQGVKKKKLRTVSQCSQVPWMHSYIHLSGTWIQDCLVNRRQRCWLKSCSGRHLKDWCGATQTQRLKLPNKQLWGWSWQEWWINNFSSSYSQINFDEKVYSLDVGSNVIKI